ncbi:MAG: hypothetical protein KY438_11070 [Actinobacteria bacterium]|nr:hypothetical protein [Actinomycetota bacterium]
MSSRHLPVVVVLIAILAGLALVDVGDPAPPRFGTASAFAMPTADPASSLSSTWFCATGAASADNDSGLVLTVANRGDEARSGTVTWFPAGAAPVVLPVEVGPRQGVTLEADEALDASDVSAMVELDGGGVGVEHTVEVAGGSSVAPCASSASDHWYLANGTTARDATQVLALFNPFPDDAIVDIAFATDQGRDEPEALQGLPVAAGTTTRINVGEIVRRREVTATSVTTRSGRVVVDRLQRFDGSNGRSGISLALAAPAPAEVWTFPAGEYQEGLAERWHVYNPSDRDAVILLEAVPDAGEVPIALERTVSARDHLIIDAAETAPVPPGVGHSSTVRSINGVGVVAERELSGIAPSPRRGWSSMLGSPLASQGWLLAYGAGTEAVADALSVHNPGTEAVRFSVTALVGGQEVPAEGLSDVELGPAQRQELVLGDVLERSPVPLVVSADGPVVVERDLSPVSDPGISTTLGIPLS